MNKKLSGLAPVLIIVLIGGVVWFSHLRDSGQTAVPLSCADIHAGCAGQLDGKPVRVGIAGELKVLQAFEVWVEAAGAGQVQASFTMEGMDMGFNLYTLRPDAAGVFRAKVTLPVCVTGRRDWVMTVEIDGRRLAVPFATEL